MACTAYYMKKIKVEIIYFNWEDLALKSSGRTRDMKKKKIICCFYNASI